MASRLSSSGAGSATTDASALTTGTLADARLSANVPLLNAANTFSSGPQIVNPSVLATANYGSLSIGGGAWDGVAAGHFVGSASGTRLAINAASGATGNLADWQVAGVSKYSVDVSGNLTLAGTLAATSLSGTLADARLSANVPLLNAANAFTAAQTITSPAAGTKPLVLKGATSQTANILEIDCATSSSSNPSTLAFTNQTSGKAYRIQLGGASDTLQSINGNSVQLTGYWGIQLIGNHQTNGSPSFSLINTAAVTIPTTNATNIGLVLKGAASQTGDLLQLQNSAGATQFAVCNTGTGGSPVWGLRVRAVANSESMVQAHTLGSDTGKAIKVIDDAGATLGYLQLYN